jgi:hypothetical protein
VLELHLAGEGVYQVLGSLRGLLKGNFVVSETGEAYDVQAEVGNGISI